MIHSTDDTPHTPWMNHIQRAMDDAGATVILASLSADGGMMLQTRSTRPQDLVAAARSLLEQARDRIHEQGFGARSPAAALARPIARALMHLPNPDDDQ